MAILNSLRKNEIQELLAFQCSKRTKDLAKVIPTKFVAVIAHDDLDRVAAESLVAAKVSAVINTMVDLVFCLKLGFLLSILIQT